MHYILVISQWNHTMTFMWITYTLIQSRRRQKQFEKGGRTKFIEKFYTCPNITDLLANFKL